MRVADMLPKVHLDADVAASLHAALGANTRAMERLAELTQRQLDQAPRAIDFSGSGQGPSSGNLVVAVNPQGPPAGRLWHVHRWIITGSQGTSTPGGKVWVHIGAYPGPAGVAPDNAQTLVDLSASSFPVPAFYSDWDVVVRHPQNLYFIVTSPDSAANYSFHGSAKEEPDALAASEVYVL